MKKRQRGLTDVDEVVLSLYANGMTTGEISARLAEICGAAVGKETISRITDKVVAEMNDWAGHPLESVYAAVSTSRSVTARSPIGLSIRPSRVTVHGHKDVLGLWMGAAAPGPDAAAVAMNELEQFVPFLDHDVEIRTMIMFRERDRIVECTLSASGPRTGISRPSRLR